MHVVLWYCNSEPTNETNVVKKKSLKDPQNAQLYNLKITLCANNTTLQ